MEVKMAWQLKEAKQKLSQLIKQAQEEGPQVVTRHGEEVAVFVSAEAYRKLSSSKEDFKSFLTGGPDLSALEIGRSDERGRVIDL